MWVRSFPSERCHYIDLQTGNTETVAKKNKDNDGYSISGYKFFTSAISSEGAVLLARIEDEKGQTVKVGVVQELFTFIKNILREVGDYQLFL